MQDNILKIAVRKFGPFETALQKIWDSYILATGSNLNLELVPLDLHELYNSTVKEGGLKNGQWDLAVINTDWIYEAYKRGAAEDLTTFIAHDPPDNYPDGWSPSLLSLQHFDNAIFGLPFHDGPECLIYRNDLFYNEDEQQKFFEKYGRKLEPPKSWDDFALIAEFFHKPEENQYGTVFAGYPDGHNTVFDFSLQLWTRGGELMDEEGQVQINTGPAAEGLEFYRTMLRNNQAIHPGSPHFDSVKSGEAFAKGEAAMMVNWFGFAAVCEVSSESKVKGKVDITYLPKGDNDRSASLNVYYLYVVGSGSKRKQDAYDFLKYAVSANNDKLLTLEGGIGCRLSTWKDPEVNAIIPYYHKLEALHQHARALPQKSNWSEIAEVIDEVVLEAVQTQRPVLEILQEGQEKIEKLNQIEK